MRTPTANNPRHAFTLIELLVVMGVIAILMTLLVPTLKAIRTHVNVVSTNATIEGVGMALEAYKLANYTYPPDLATGLSSQLNLSSECVVFWISGASISYSTSTAPVGYPWTNTLFKDLTGSARRAMIPYYTFKENTLADQDADGIPELIDPWQHRFTYNTGSTGNDTNNQFNEPKHNLKKFDLFSAGPDGIFGNTDDVRNWKDSLTDTYSTLHDAL